MPRSTRDVSIRHGRDRAALRVPDDAAILTGKSIPPLADAPAAVRHALRQPIGSEPLAAIAQRKQPRTVTITLSDITRPVPNELLITAILDELRAAGVRDDQVTLLIATGMHRPSTDAERLAMLGADLLRRCRVVDHQADDAAMLVPVSDDPPVSVNRLFIEADLKIVTGLIEPHFMAGFSGGRKGICPGLVDLKTVERFHGYRVMGDMRSVEGRLDDNPCHAEAMRIAGKVGCDFLVNVAITHDRQAAGIYAGDMVEAHRVGCAEVAEWNSAAVDQPFDLVITSAGGHPLDANFYQSVKGMVTALPALHERSTLLIFSACAEIGSPEYTAVMKKYGHDHRAFLHDIQHAPVTKDQWQYQMHTRVLDRIGPRKLMIANDGLPPEVLASLACTPVEETGDATARAQRFVDAYLHEHPAATVAAIPEGPYTMLTAPATTAAAAGV